MIARRTVSAIRSRGRRVALDGARWTWSGRNAIALGCAAALLAIACQPTAATREDCEGILARIIELELREQGYRDPALFERKRLELTRRFDADLRACVGRPLPSDAMRCIAAAKSSEAISHSCLR
jgi:hypothetical protein